MATNDYMIFAGGSNIPLAKNISSLVGKPLGMIELKRFSDGEIWVKYGENIRGEIPSASYGSRISSQ